MFRLGAAIILALLLSPLPARAELWRCQQAGGSDLFTDKLTDPRTCRKYETGADVSVAPSSSTTAFAQPDAPMQGRPAFTLQELDQMLAPIALYPDSLLSQILIAATYPLEVVEAARWSRANPNLTGDQAVQAVAQNSWDPSVKSLVAFPQILTMMDEKLDWMQKLGDAFLAQQAQVMDTVQNLRQRAYDAGNLKTTDQVRVEQQGQAIVVEPSNPQVIYVPYYDPTVIYGPWWWPAYPPVYWAPWPGYFVRPGFFVGFTWGLGIAVGERFFFGACDWPRRHVIVVNVNNFYYNTVAVNRGTNITGNVWRHDPIHRRGVSYRDASLRRQFGRTSALPEARRDFRGHDPSSLEGRSGFVNSPEARGGSGGRPEERGSSQSAVGGLGARPNMGGAPGRSHAPDVSRSDQRSAGSRPSAPSGGNRPEVRSSPPSRVHEPDVSRSDQRSAGSRPSAPSGGGRPHVEQRPHIERQPHAFGGVGQGAAVRNFSERGHASTQGSAPRSSGNVRGGSETSRR
jgi:hypothetical protein